MLDVRDLVKVYPSGVRGNDGVSLQVAPGEVLGLLGHNGAGKTTLINQVVGLARPTAGSIRLLGADPVADPAFARRACSLMPQAHAPLTGVTPRQAIESIARIRGAGARHARAETARLVEGLDIAEWAHTRGERLSGGLRRLTAFAMCAARPGRLVMLDEPTNDVDPTRRRLVWAHIAELARAGHAVLLVTHNVAEAERAVDRLAVLDQGRVVAYGTPAELKAPTQGRLRLQITTDAAVPAVPVETCGETLRQGRTVTVPIPTRAAGEALAWAQQAQQSGRLEEFSISPASLEDVYVEIIETRRSEGGSLPR